MAHDTLPTEKKSELLKKLDAFQWLGKITPCFPTNGSKVQILSRPEEFFNTLVEKTVQSKERITLASLYLGTGSHEKHLVKTIETVLKSESGSFKPKVSILLDASRGSRGSDNSRKTLLPLVQSYSEQCSVHLYHTPALRGFLKAILPERFNEVVGLQHMKIYIFDDALIISGANLSHDYFTNRQDRYLLIEDCKDLANFYNELVETVCQFSFRLDGNNDLYMDPNFPHHPFKSTGDHFATEAKRRIDALFEKQLCKNSESFLGFQHYLDSADTWIFPFVQMGQLGIFMDNICTAKILENVPYDAELCLATGYFNLTQEYMNSLLDVAQPNVHILMAHPSANGFLGARGVAGGIPAAYTLLAYQFYRRLLDRAHDARIRLWEYRRQGWTFHAKGLWISFTSSGDPRPCFTLIGSPNFGYRSVYRDLETQLAIVTTNSSLRDQLDRERRNLFQPVELVNESTFDRPERKVPLWVRFVIKVFRRFF
nr:EOG090X08SX [Eurycercus lamellatus]